MNKGKLIFISPFLLINKKKRKFRGIICENCGVEVALLKYPKSWKRLSWRMDYESRNRNLMISMTKYERKKHLDKAENMAYIKFFILIGVWVFVMIMMAKYLRFK